MRLILRTFLMFFVTAGGLNAAVLNPLSVPGCNLYLDATDTSTLTLDVNNRVLSWLDKSTGLVFVAPDLARAPLYVPNSPLGPAVYFEPLHYLKASVNNWMGNQGQIGMNIRYNELAAETFPLSSADEQSDSKYTMFYTRRVSGISQFGIRLRNQPDNPSFNGSVEADGSSILVDTNYSLSVRGFGTGGSLASYDFWGNGVTYPPTYFSNTALINSWMGGVTGRDNLIVGAFETLSGPQQTGSFYISQMVAFDQPLNNSQNEEFHNYLLNPSAIPEPSTYAALGLLSIAILYYRKATKANCSRMNL